MKLKLLLRVVGFSLMVCAMAFVIKHPVVFIVMLFVGMYLMLKGEDWE